jgi:hypothetical protein
VDDVGHGHHPAVARDEYPGADLPEADLAGGGDARPLDRITTTEGRAATRRSAMNQAVMGDLLVGTITIGWTALPTLARFRLP